MTDMPFLHVNELGNLKTRDHKYAKKCFSRVVVLDVNAVILSIVSMSKLKNVRAAQQTKRDVKVIEITKLRIKRNPVIAQSSLLISIFSHFKGLYCADLVRTMAPFLLSVGIP